MASPPERAAGLVGCMHPPWQVEAHEVVDTTQALARAKPAWHAVVAAEQRRGRGQRERGFVSDRGGLYLTAVLPYTGDPLAARGFALAVGWSLREALSAQGGALRLRWPNDLLVGTRKVGGILVEQAGRDTLLVGVGLNVANRPWETDPLLRETAGSLADCGHPAAHWPRPQLVERLLAAVARAHAEFCRAGFAGLVPRLNEGWGGARPVVLELVGAREPVRGLFAGVHESGDLVLRDAGGAWVRVPEHHVARLREE